MHTVLRPFKDPWTVINRNYFRTDSMGRHYLLTGQWAVGRRFSTPTPSVRKSVRRWRVTAPLIAMLLTAELPGQAWSGADSASAWDDVCFRTLCVMSKVYKARIGSLWKVKNFKGWEENKWHFLKYLLNKYIFKIQSTMGKVQLNSHLLQNNFNKTASLSY